MPTVGPTRVVRWPLWQAAVMWWPGTPTSPGGVSVKARIYDEDGNAVGDEFEVAVTSSAQPRRLAIEGLDDGGFVLLWDEDLPLVPEYSIYGQRYDSGGHRGGKQIPGEHRHRGQCQERLGVLLERGGGFVVTWGYSGGAAWEVFGQRYNADGTANEGQFPE